MFVPTRIRAAERFLGSRTAPADLQSRVGINGRAIDALNGVVDSLAAAGLPFYIALIATLILEALKSRAFDLRAVAVERYVGEPHP